MTKKHVSLGWRSILTSLFSKALAFLHKKWGSRIQSINTTLRSTLTMKRQGSDIQFPGNGPRTMTTWVTELKDLTVCHRSTGSVGAGGHPRHLKEMLLIPRSPAHRTRAYCSSETPMLAPRHRGAHASCYIHPDTSTQTISHFRCLLY